MIILDTKDIRRDLRHRRDMGPVYLPVVSDVHAGVYRPGGLWYAGSADAKRVPGVSSALFFLPPPYHPLEVLACRHYGVWTDTDSIVRAAEKRADRWYNQIPAWAQILALTVPETYLLYHLFTPLHTNGGGPYHEKLRDETTWLYLAAGLPLPGTQCNQAWDDRAAGVPYSFCCMNFWGGLVPEDF